MQRARQDGQQSSGNQDWLLRSYEEQTQRNPATAHEANFYLQMSSDKELAALAGIPQMTIDHQALASSQDAAAKAIHDAAATANTSTQRSDPFKWRPLITPLGSPALQGVQSVYSPAPLSTLSPLFATQAPAQAPKARATRNIDTESLETPGLVAAEKNPAGLLDSTPNLTLDLLPGESPADALRHQKDALLPVPINADQLHQQQAEQMSPTKPKTTTSSTTATTSTATSSTTVTSTTPAKNNQAQANQSQVNNLTPIKTPDDEAATPATQLQPVSPVRSPIASPYSILNR